MRESIPDLVGKINFGLRRIREMFVEQGRTNTQVELRLTQVEKELAKLKEDLYLSVYNIERGVNEK